MKTANSHKPDAYFWRRIARTRNLEKMENALLMLADNMEIIESWAEEHGLELPFLYESPDKIRDIILRPFTDEEHEASSFWKKKLEISSDPDRRFLV